MKFYGFSRLSLYSMTFIMNSWPKSKFYDFLKILWPLGGLPTLMAWPLFCFFCYINYPGQTVYWLANLTSLIFSVLLIANMFYFLIWITQNDVVKEKKLNSILLISEMQSFSISQDKKLLNGPRWILSFWLIKCNQLRLHGR